MTSLTGKQGPGYAAFGELVGIAFMIVGTTLVLFSVKVLGTAISLLGAMVALPLYVRRNT